jgi:hypothetical protein
MSGFLPAFYADNKQLDAKMPVFCPFFCPLPRLVTWACFSLKHGFSPSDETRHFPEIG